MDLVGIIRVLNRSRQETLTFLVKSKIILQQKQIFEFDTVTFVHLSSEFTIRFLTVRRKWLVIYE